MRHEIEPDRLESIERQITVLQDKVSIQHVVITGLLAQLLTLSEGNYEQLIGSIREELDKYPYQSDEREIYRNEIEKMLRRFLPLGD